MKDVGKIGRWVWASLAALILFISPCMHASAKCLPSDCMAIPGDFNCDDGVDLVDAALFMSHWLDDTCFDPACCEYTDLSGLVDYADYALFADNFGTCPLQWTSIGGQPNGMNGSVEALTVFDDGGGPALYAGGQFTTAGGVAANNIAKW